MFFRLFNPQPLFTPAFNSTDILSLQTKSNKKIFHKTKDFDITYITNSRGFRGKEYDYKKEAHLSRILVLGDYLFINLIDFISEIYHCKFPCF